MTTRYYSLFILLPVLSAFFKPAKAQTKYGDGTLQLKSSHLANWDAVQSKYISKDSNSYSYNSKGLQTEMYQRTYDPMTSLWKGYYVELDAYDQQGNVITYVDSFLTADQLNSRYRATYKFNASNQEIQNLQSYWDLATSNWLLDERATTTYNTKGKESLDLRESFVASNGSWLNSILRTYTFTTSDEADYYIKQVWDNTAKSWVDEYKVLYHYNALKYTDTMIIQKYNTATKVWVNESKNSYSYDVFNRLFINANYSWISNAWVPNGRNTYSYETDGQPRLHLYETWDSQIKNLQHNFLTSYYYDANMRLITKTGETWVNKNQWVFSNKEIHDYNANGYEIKQTYLKFNSSLSTWDSTYKTRFHYISNPLIGIPTIAEPEKPFSIYPNPASQSFSLLASEGLTEKYTITLLNSIGMQVAVLSGSKFPINKRLQFDLTPYSLPSGLYYISIQSKDNACRLPLIIR